MLRFLFLEWWNRPDRERRHARCLANIERLERELFPERFKDERAFKQEWLDELQVGPGARWIVEEANMVQVMGGYGLVDSSALAALRHKHEIIRQVAG